MPFILIRMRNARRNLDRETESGVCVGGGCGSAQVHNVHACTCVETRRGYQMSYAVTLSLTLLRHGSLTELGTQLIFCLVLCFLCLFLFLFFGYAG